MSFNSKLTDLLKTNPNFVDDEGELLLAAVQDRAWKLDHELIRLLLSDPELKAKFFDQIDGSLLFNTRTFIEYISQKNFLDSSYTRFRNRIGLTIDGKYLSERGEVSLAWAYKDCVLEGGQTKEEEKRREIFFNEVLAQDEINRMFDPKVLTNFTRYTTAGEEPVAELRRDESGVIRENLIIKGNNLIALHSLKEQFHGKIKLIYIDPPYNTGGYSFGYNDNFNHSSWLTFMRNRLEVAREFLQEDGSIWINIDDDEAHYLKVICDELLGRDNFVTSICWQKIHSIKNDARLFSINHDYLLVYAKNISKFKVNMLHRTELMNSRYSNPDHDSRGDWMSGDLVASGHRVNGNYLVVGPRGDEFTVPYDKHWVYSKENLDELIANDEIWFGKTGNAFPRKKRFLKDVQQGRTPDTWWKSDECGHNQEAKREVKALKFKNVFSTPKPERLLKRVIELASNPSDIVLDFFIGSGTTSSVAHKLQRQYIGIEQIIYSEDYAVDRLRLVISGEQGGISKTVNWIGGGDFISCELMKYNQAFLDRIKDAENSSALLQIWQEMAENSFLNWYVNPKLPEDAIKTFIEIGKEENGLVKQKKLLMELLDKNQLYVNLSEIDDAKFNVSDEDRALNKAFYGEN